MSMPSLSRSTASPEHSGGCLITLQLDRRLCLGQNNPEFIAGSSRDVGAPGQIPDFLEMVGDILGSRRRLN